MPSRSLRPCAYGGCANLVESGYCDAHRGLAAAVQPDHHREWQHLYNSARWRKIRARQLIKAPFCAECMKRGVFTMATDVDHIEPHRGDIVLFFRGPFQSLCHPCHSKKTAIEINSAMEGRVREKVFK